MALKTAFFAMGSHFVRSVKTFVPCNKVKPSHGGYMSIKIAHLYLRAASPGCAS